MKLLEVHGLGIEDIYWIDKAMEEFEDAVDEKWIHFPPFEPPKRYRDQLRGDLVVLSEYKQKSILLSSFEQIEKDIYCIRHPETKKNVRVLYTITEDGQVVLLHAFLEKRRSDYNNAKAVARRRLMWLNS